MKNMAIEGIAIILAMAKKNLILYGVFVFLPYATENQQKYSITLIHVTLSEHGVLQYGRVGAKLTKISGIQNLTL